MGFPVVMYCSESWTIKKAECRKIDVFKLWCWRRPLRIPWTERRSNQSILKEISPEYSLEGLMMKLKLQYFGHLMQRIDSKDPDAGKDWRWEEKGVTEDEMIEWHHRLNGHEFEQTPEDSEGQRSLVCCSPLDCKDLYMTERLSLTEPQCSLELFTIARTWKQPRCPSTDEWIKKQPVYPFFQGTLQTQGSNRGLLHYRQILYRLN